MDTIVKIAKRILWSLGQFEDEEVLCVPRRLFEKEIGFSDKKIVRPSSNSLARLINGRGTYMARSLAEKSNDFLQVVPICVIRNGDRYLTNRRHEPGESLHEAFGNWAGGHVRKQDAKEVRSKWSSVEVGLRRELHEELSLEDLPPLHLVGIVHSSEDLRASRHLGIVFETELSSAANFAAFENKTIRERPNRFVKTAWMRREELSRNINSQRDWSRAISHFLVSA